MQPVQQHVLFTGKTMGTTYEVKLPDANLKPRATRKLQNDFERRLEEINQRMSTYVENSEVFRFNQQTTTNPFSVSLETGKVVRDALQLASDSGGSFDPTILPLVHIWGFNNSTNPPSPPTASTLSSTRAKVGWRKLSVPRNDQLKKSEAELCLDLGGIAKGYAVDQLSTILNKAAFENYYVNIGGEIRTQGTSTNGTPWSIAIETPVVSPQQELYEIVSLSGVSMATSGDYRNFYVGEDGRHYAHIIDPASGKPTTNQLASVSVIAPTCMEADGVATALFVMGAQSGLHFAELREDVEAFVIVRDGTNGFKHAMTSGFPAYLRQ